MNKDFKTVTDFYLSGMFLFNYIKEYKDVEINGLLPSITFALHEL